MVKSVNSISHWLIFLFFFLTQNVTMEWDLGKSNLLKAMQLQGRNKLQK